MKVLLATMLAAFIVASLHPPIPNDTRAPQDTFWAGKTLQSAHYDIVIGGDSRSAEGFSPDAMNEILTSDRIFNFAYMGNANSDVYLDWLARHIDPSSKKKQIIVGITPYSLTAIANTNNNFLDTKHTVFGKVVAGASVADTINNVATAPGERPLQPVVIKSITLK